MDSFLLSLQTIPGLSPVLLVGGLAMILLDIKKLYALALRPGDKKNKPDLKFYLIFPGLLLFVIGYQIMMVVPPK